MKPILCLAILCISAAALANQQNEKKNCLFLQVIQTFKLSHNFDMRIISIGYERFIPTWGVSLGIPLHGGYKNEENEKSYAIGCGIILKKYMNGSFQGGYPFVFAEGLYESNERENWHYRLGSSVTDHREQQIRNFGLGYGYLWMWSQVALDFNLGCEFHISDEIKETRLLGNVNIGFPFRLPL